MPYYSARDASSSDSEDGESPESIFLSQSKKEVQKAETERKHAEIAQRTAKKDKRREMDRKLKERAIMNKRGNKGGGRIVKSKVDERDELEKRMQRAMQDAEELESDPEEFRGINFDEDADPDYEDSNSFVRHPDHLPDELFAAAFGSSSKRKKFDDGATTSRPEKKRKSSKEEKDIVVGSVAIRVLPNSSTPPVHSTNPSQKITKFLDRTLALKDAQQNLHTRGWERRPVNIGVLKRDGPPISFVRKR